MTYRPIVTTPAALTTASVPQWLADEIIEASDAWSAWIVCESDVSSEDAKADWNCTQQTVHDFVTHNWPQNTPMTISPIDVMNTLACAAHGVRWR